MSEYQPITRKQLADAVRMVLVEFDEEQICGKILEIAEKQPVLTRVMTGVLSDVIDGETCRHFWKLFLIIYLSCVNPEDDIPCIKLDEVTDACCRVVARIQAITPDLQIPDKILDSISEPDLWIIIFEEIKKINLGDTKEERGAVLILSGILETLTTARRKYGKTDKMGKSG